MASTCTQGYTLCDWPPWSGGIAVPTCPQSSAWRLSLFQESSDKPRSLACGCWLVSEHNGTESYCLHKTRSPRCATLSATCNKIQQIKSQICNTATCNKVQIKSQRCNTLQHATKCRSSPRYFTLLHIEDNVAYLGLDLLYFVAC